MGQPSIGQIVSFHQIAFDLFYAVIPCSYIISYHCTMKVLVTGSNGLLGQKLTDYYKTHFHI